MFDIIESRFEGHVGISDVIKVDIKRSKLEDTEFNGITVLEINKSDINGTQFIAKLNKTEKLKADICFLKDTTIETTAKEIKLNNVRLNNVMLIVSCDTLDLSDISITSDSEADIYEVTIKESATLEAINNFAKQKNYLGTPISLMLTESTYNDKELLFELSKFITDAVDYLDLFKKAAKQAIFDKLKCNESLSAVIESSYSDKQVLSSFTKVIADVGVEILRAQVRDKNQILAYALTDLKLKRNPFDDDTKRANLDIIEELIETYCNLFNNKLSELSTEEVKLFKNTDNTSINTFLTNVLKEFGNSVISRVGHGTFTY